MLFQISHTTSYIYEVGVTFCHNIATIKPKDMLGQKVVDYKLEISPTPTEFSEKLDFFGNTITRFSIQEQHKTLKVTALSKILRDHTLEPDIYKSESGQKITLIEALAALKTENRGHLDIKQFVLESILIANISKDIRAYAEVSFKPNRPIFEAAYELMERIFKDFEFNPNVTNVATPIHEVMVNKKGVCQDFAQIAIACIRSVGLPARYVSGYIETLPPPGKEKLVGTDASHAWFSIYIPSFGWVDFDPTNNQIPKDQHIVVAYGRDYYDVPPLKGVIYSSGANKMKVAVDIRPAV
ncbi:transglutaminase family protein [Algibacter amylolyticus]|uniref:Transglutaminase family protein n=1 Tax=Algibacter amylolyticus TaxID=1608400 RepID=A0A5M7AYM5_9FLAO|nr:transglutaminase family protein [Algibacter amylolyticus]KAA5821168.1 transglutaminase family protein [Algibacter amylolyticus]MBB5269813.1 transglutaminase-like putative cysteine protease [Algibacter amylolyticus]TSJ72114.1 transglutaminase family protein [Algibacter amylolyticus]